MHLLGLAYSHNNEANIGTQHVEYAQVADFVVGNNRYAGKIRKYGVFLPQRAEQKNSMGLVTP